MFISEELLIFYKHCLSVSERVAGMSNFKRIGFLFSLFCKYTKHNNYMANMDVHEIEQLIKYIIKQILHNYADNLYKEELE